jgi:DNA-binding response OmpR family regulator
MLGVMETQVLVVEDEPLVAEVVARYLERERYRVTSAADGEAGWRAFIEARPHLVVLDLMLPGLSGMDLCRRIRVQGDTPVIMLTARGDEMDRIAGFEVGADDYLSKPFSPRELVARVRAVLKRSYDGPPTAAGRITSAAITLDLAARSATVDGRRVELTHREFDLLAFLMANPRRVFSREQLLDRVWQEGWFSDTGTVTVHVRRLRTKIEDDPENPARIKTVWGLGYRWEG